MSNPYRLMHGSSWGRCPSQRLDRVVGLSPAIAIEQKPASKNPRSTVGTVTEGLRLSAGTLRAIGRCILSRLRYVGRQAVRAGIVARVLKIERRLYLLAPIELGKGEDYTSLINRFRREGHLRGRLNGHVFNLSNPPEIDYKQSHRLEILIDRVTAQKKNRKRIADSVESALDISGGILIVASPDDGEETRFSQHLSCPSCGRSFETVTPQHLSFNSSEGWCLSCEGLGTQRGMGIHTLIPDIHKSLSEGTVLPWGKVEAHTQLGTCYLQSAKPPALTCIPPLRGYQRRDNMRFCTVWARGG